MGLLNALFSGRSDAAASRKPAQSGPKRPTAYVKINTMAYPVYSWDHDSFVAEGLEAKMPEGKEFKCRFVVRDIGDVEGFELDTSAGVVKMTGDRLHARFGPMSVKNRDALRDASRTLRVG